MHILINERSFISQANTSEEISKLISILLEVIRELQPIKGTNQIHVHSNFLNYNLSPTYTVNRWFKTHFPNDDSKRFFRLLLTLGSKGPYIDRLLDQKLSYHDCIFKQINVTSSSLAGAAYLEGTLVSLQNAPDFIEQTLTVQFSIDGKDYQDKHLPNLTTPDQIWTVRPKYVPTAKHAKGGWGTEMDLSDKEAQIVLDNGIPYGKRIISYYQGKFYNFMPDNAGGYHGYPVNELDVPTPVFRKLKEKGIL